MKSGSIVVVLPSALDIRAQYLPYVKWMPHCDEKTPYMIRDITTFQGKIVGVNFEEGIIGMKDGAELYLEVEHVREILPALEVPLEIEEEAYA